MYEEYLKEALYIGLVAKDKILEIYHTDFPVEIKSDNSPVTLADKTADNLIKNYLKEKFPNHAFLTEESTDDLSRLDNDYVWIIDPVDGTKDFVAKDDEFTTCIALAYKHEVIVGIVIAPAKEEVYYALKGQGSFYLDLKTHNVQQIHVNDKIDNLTCYTSVFHTNETELSYIEKHKDKITKVIKRGSSLKPCEIARGLAEITYRLSPYTKEWDTAANQIIVEEAGGLFLEPDGSRIMYNRKDVYNRNGYIVVNRKENILL